MATTMPADMTKTPPDDSNGAPTANTERQPPALPPSNERNGQSDQHHPGGTPVMRGGPTDAHPQGLPPSQVPLAAGPPMDENTWLRQHQQNPRYSGNYHDSSSFGHPGMMPPPPMEPMGGMPEMNGRYPGPAGPGGYSHMGQMHPKAPGYVNNDDFMAAAKIRAAGIAAAAAERDYQVATFNLQRQLEAADIAKKRQSMMGSGSGSNAGTIGRAPEDDLEVAQACLNLRQDVADDPRISQQFHHPSRMFMPPRGTGQDNRAGHMQGGPQYGMPPHMGGMHGQIKDMSPYMVDQGGHFYPTNTGEGMGSDQYIHAASMMNQQMHNQKRPLDQSPPGQDEKRRRVASPIEEKRTVEKLKKGKRPSDMPRRPLSAYNFFFSEERERVLAAIPDTGSEKKAKDKEEEKEKNSEAETEAEAASQDKKSSESGSPNTKTEAIKSNTKRLLALREKQSATRRPHRKTHGKIGFKALAKLIGERWRALPAGGREYYVGLAETDLGRYKEQMKAYHRKTKWSFLGEQTKPPSPPPVGHPEHAA